MTQAFFGDFSQHFIKSYDWVDFTTGEHGNYPSVDLAPGWWICEGCGVPMLARYLSVPCCGAPYECMDDGIEQPFCAICDLPEPNYKYHRDSYNDARGSVNA